MKKVLEILYFGYGVLSCAIVINYIGRGLGLKSWQDIFTTTSFFSLNVIELLWLFIVYPVFWDLL